MKIAICDDEEAIVWEITGVIESYAKEEGMLVETMSFFSGIKLEEEVRKGERFDLIYLDIHMKDEKQDGIITAENIRKLDSNFLLVYISVHAGYAVRLFRLQVMEFLEKPIDKDKLIATLLSAYQKIRNERTKMYFTYKLRGFEHRICVNEIIYFKSEGRNLLIYTDYNHVIKYYDKLNEAEKRIRNKVTPFLRPHQSFLVNFEYIICHSKSEIVMKGNLILPISDDRKEAFHKDYSRLLRGDADE